MDKMKIGAALGTCRYPSTGMAPSWAQMREASLAAEQAGFDTLWIADELLWEFEDDTPPLGWWDCVATASAIAASTTTIEVGSWVLSALHRNPGLMVKAVETLDAVSEGRFIFGLGAGHAGRQGEAFGYPPDRTVSRYADALEIIVPLLRNGAADHDGPYHSAKSLLNDPRGPQGPSIPLMLGGHKTRTIGLAVQHADIWSAYATTGSHASHFVDMVAMVDRICDEQGRDPLTLGRSASIVVHRTDCADSVGFQMAPPIKGTTGEIVAELAAFADLGFTRIELVAAADSTKDIEMLAPIVAAAHEI